MEEEEKEEEKSKRRRRFKVRVSLSRADQTRPTILEEASTHTQTHTQN